jgi:transposase
MVPLLSHLLGLPGIDVETYTEDGNQLILSVEAHQESAMCPRCNRVSEQLHQNHRYRVRDLAISHYQTWLEVNRRQFKCFDCGKPFSESLSFVEPRRSYTERYAASIVQQVMHSDTRNVALKEGLTEDLVWSMVEYMSKKK